MLFKWTKTSKWKWYKEFATNTARRTDVPFWKMAGGVALMITSRVKPPPSAAITERILTPKMSIPLFIASIAPEAAKATIPINPKIVINDSVII